MNLFSERKFYSYYENRVQTKKKIGSIEIELTDGRSIPWGVCFGSFDDSCLDWRIVEITNKNGQFALAFQDLLWPTENVMEYFVRG